MIEKLSCVSCGGRLEVPERTRYLNCNHCDQSLAVKHSETATFTEAMEQLTEVAEDVAALLFFASTGCVWLAASLSTLETAKSYQSSKREYELKRQRLREQTD